jgi:hypothetical protein
MAAKQMLAELYRRTAPRSFWRERLARRATPLTVHEYLIDEANLRGYWGAFRATIPARPRDLTLQLDDIVVGLLAPQAPPDARALKLVLRIIQGGELNLRILLLRARREGAIFALYWLLGQVPAEERTAPVEAVIAGLATPPRGYHRPQYSYDPRRLVRRAARKDDLWRKPPS